MLLTVGFGQHAVGLAEQRIEMTAVGEPQPQRWVLEHGAVVAVGVERIGKPAEEDDREFQSLGGVDAHDLHRIGI